ncbi:hypothetical protein CLU83_2447 [Flavobacterium sp. 1]|nr:hypothetical protein CLU83_2447 [Flavobacterium sp. 1]
MIQIWLNRRLSFFYLKLIIKKQGYFLYLAVALKELVLLFPEFLNGFYSIFNSKQLFRFYFFSKTQQFIIIENSLLFFIDIETKFIFG